MAIKPISVSWYRVCPGYFPAMKQPTLMVEFAFPGRHLDAEHVGGIKARLQTIIPELAEQQLSKSNGYASLLGLVALVYEEILKKAGIPLLCRSRREYRDGKPNCMVFYLPLLGENSATPYVEMLRWVVQAVNSHQQESFSSAVIADFGRVLQRLTFVAPSGINSRRFIEEADRLDIPWKKIIGNVYRFGIGSRSRLLDSSFTDRTSIIGSNIARDKTKTAQLLLSAGLPGARHVHVSDEQNAVRLAAELGYPVVIKPADRDGGVGVSAGLTTESMVKKAFAQARTVSSRILVEKHFEGNDYRIHVLQGEVYWIAHRHPGGVTGDGVHNIVELLAIVNADPRRGPRGSNALLKIIELDEEAQELLHAAGMNRHSVPQAEQFIRLRRTANVASGGFPVPALEGAHPDNLELAVRAAGLLRLDIAGIDLLIPDIKRSWLESGALICEINAQPQLSTTLPGYLLEKLVKGKGRIPFVVVLGAAPDWLKSSVERLSASEISLGVLWPDGVYIDGHKTMECTGPTFQGCQALLHDRRVEGVVLCLTDDELMYSGFPLDRFDSLMLVEPGVEMSSTGRKNMQDFARFLAELSTGEIVVESNSPLWDSLSGSLPANRIRLVAEADFPPLFELELESCKHD